VKERRRMCLLCKGPKGRRRLGEKYKRRLWDKKNKRRRLLIKKKTCGLK
jgi:hypothetical protein